MSYINLKDLTALHKLKVFFYIWFLQFSLKVNCNEIFGTEIMIQGNSTLKMETIDVILSSQNYLQIFLKRDRKSLVTYLNVYILYAAWACGVGSQ